MNIAMITPGMLPVPAVNGGAVEVLIQYLIEGNEKEKNYSIDLYTVANNELGGIKYNHTNIIEISPSFFTKAKNIVINNIYRLFGIKKWRTSYGRAVVKKMNKQKYDYVVVHNNLMAYRDIYEKTDNKDNLVYVLHNNADDGDENHRIIVELVAKTAKKILAVSEHTKKDFLSLCYTDNIDVLYNCIDEEKYLNRITEKERSILRGKYGISEEDFVFLYSGRLDVYKGVLELIESFNTIKKQNVKLLIVGESWFDKKSKSDQYTNSLVKAAEKSKEQIIFTGFINPCDMPSIYQISDCLVIPSIWEEPFGVVALEGMASKVFLIVTNSGGLMEIVDEKCAFIVNKEKNMVDDLAEKMNFLLDDDQVREEKIAAGYRVFNSRMDFHKECYYGNFCRKIGC